jgi:hypothetical protein
MLDELLPCANCAGQPHFDFDTDIHMVRLHCQTCFMSTPKIPITANRNAAVTELVNIWNTRPNRVETTAGSIEDLIKKEVRSIDTPLVMELLARNTEDWEARGPLLSALAAKCIDSSLAYSDWWPMESLIKDAARYRKLLQLGKFYIIDGKQTLRFPAIDAIEPDDHPRTFDTVANMAIDALPDRDRW